MWAKELFGNFRLHADVPLLKKDKTLFLDVYYASDSSFHGLLNIRYFMYLKSGDSILVLGKQNLKVNYKAGTHKVRILLNEPDSNTVYSTCFFEILKRTNNIPPGSYKIFLNTSMDDHQFNSQYLREIDSTLKPNTLIRKDIGKRFMPKKRSLLGFSLNNQPGGNLVLPQGNESKNLNSSLDRDLKKRGLTAIHTKTKNKKYINLYYQEWFAGRYEVKTTKDKAKPSEGNIDPADKSSFSNTNMDHPSLYSQSKNKGKSDKEDIKGEVGFSTNVSSGKEQNSAVDNNYMEIKGRIDIPVGEIPVTVEGLYTTLDFNRQIKSSYFRAHYDVEKVKEALFKSISAYNTKFQETKSKSVGMGQVYGSALSNLQKQRSRLQNEIDTSTKNQEQIKFNKPKLSDKQLNLSNNSLSDSLVKFQKEQRQKDTGIITNNSLTRSLNEIASDDVKFKYEVVGKENEIEAKRKMLQSLDKKIEKYKILLAQSSNTNYFDSTLGYNKTKDISNQGDMTYKQMVKRSSNLLPDGQAKKFMSGVTSMDAGIFSKSSSQFTMAGQQMKGLDFGYDLGICETGITIGKTQYIGRDGNLDKYTFYSGQAKFKPAKNQEIGLIYYSYSPDQKMVLGDGFFRNANISTPGFFEPVQIVSLKYDGELTKYIKVGGETAVSIKNSDKSDLPKSQLDEKMAYHFNTDANIPNSSIVIQATYDKTGMGFINNTLPLTSIGNEKYKLSIKNDFFHSFLIVGIDYNQITQNNFASKGKSVKWGFDIKTHSKKYPNVALSYKPFSTFHSYTDTLSIPQRPLFGSVWTGKASYQIKWNHQSLRFLAMYTSSKTILDTTTYGSSLIQLSAIYTGNIIAGLVGIGCMDVNGTNILPPTSPNKTRFLNLNGNYAINKQLSVTVGQEFGVASFGFCRYSFSNGIIYHPKKQPFVLRVNGRFNTFELMGGGKWSQLYSGNIDITYRFKAKNVNKGRF